MSASLVKQPVLIDFVAPVALNTDTTFTDATNGVDSYTPKTLNIMRDLRYSVDPVAGLNYVLATKRLDEKRKTIGFTGDFLRANVRPAGAIGDAGMALNPGFFQFVEQQILGALTAQSYVVTFEQPLNV